MIIGEEMRELTIEEERQLDEYLEIANDDNNGKVLRKRCFRKALEITPDDLDIQVDLIMLDLESLKDVDKIIARIEEVEKKAEEELTKGNYWEDKGDFWLVFETRPYMRLLKTKLELYKLQEGKAQEIIELCNKMLDLNTRDNQGVRYSLMPIYAANGDLEGATKLREKYPEKSSMFLFPLAYLFFKIGKLDEAIDTLKQLDKMNSYVLDFYLKGFDFVVDSDIPDMYFPGGEEEALIILNENTYVYFDEDFEEFVKQFNSK